MNYFIDDTLPITLIYMNVVENYESFFKKIKFEIGEVF